MKTGIELITDELEKRAHVLNDLPNDEDQFLWASAHLLTSTFARPKGWSKEVWNALCNHNPATRIAIAGALVVVALDKIRDAESKKLKDTYASNKDALGNIDNNNKIV